MEAEPALWRLCLARTRGELSSAAGQPPSSFARPKCPIYAIEIGALGPILGRGGEVLGGLGEVLWWARGVLSVRSF